MRRRQDDTAAQILDVAERLAQTRGFNGFSYADVAAELGLTKASLHYHFAGKAELGRALVDRYAAAFARALAQIASDGEAAPVQLERYVAIYADVLKAGRICLCGMLAAEYSTLPPGMQAAVRAFFDYNEEWLAGVLDGGRRAGALEFEGTPRGAARAITAGLEGAMLLARPFGDRTRFIEAARRMLNDLTPARRRARATAPAGARRARTGVAI